MAFVAFTFGFRGMSIVRLVWTDGTLADLTLAHDPCHPRDRILPEMHRFGRTSPMTRKGACSRKRLLMEA